MELYLDTANVAEVERLARIYPLAWSLWLFVLRNLPASIAGLSTLAVPVCGVLFSWWLLHENPGKVEGCGIALIVLALAMIRIKRRGA